MEVDYRVIAGVKRKQRKRRVVGRGLRVLERDLHSRKPNRKLVRTRNAQIGKDAHRQ